VKARERDRSANPLLDDDRSDATVADEQPLLDEALDRLADLGLLTPSCSDSSISLSRRCPGWSAPLSIALWIRSAIWKYSGTGLVLSRGWEATEHSLMTRGPDVNTILDSRGRCVPCSG
jgi:hypothetical protein